MQNPNVPEKDEFQEKIDKEFDRLANEFADKKVEEALYLQPSQLLHKEALFQRYKKEMEQEFQSFKAGQANGVSKLALSLQELAKEKPELFSENVIEGITRISQLSDMIAQDEQAYEEQMSRGVTLQEFVGVDDAVIETLYQAGKRLYDKQLFDDAADAFGFLTLLDPDNYAFWLALGNAEYERKHFKEALSAYSTICRAIPDDPACHLSVSRCYMKIGEIDKAITALDLCLSAIEKSNEYVAWKEDLVQEKRKLQQMLRH